jgi:hypothetical protein
MYVPNLMWDLLPSGIEGILGIRADKSGYFETAHFHPMTSIHLTPTHPVIDSAHPSGRYGYAACGVRRLVFHQPGESSGRRRGQRLF